MRTKIYKSLIKSDTKRRVTMNKLDDLKQQILLDGIDDDWFDD